MVNIVAPKEADRLTRVSGARDMLANQPDALPAMAAAANAVSEPTQPFPRSQNCRNAPLQRYGGNQINRVTVEELRGLKIPDMADLSPGRTVSNAWTASDVGSPSRAGPITD